MARYEFKFDKDLEMREWFQGDTPILALPDENGLLKDQRAAVRALNLLFPKTGITLLSHTDLDDGSVVTRVVKMDIKRREDA